MLVLVSFMLVSIVVIVLIVRYKAAKKRQKEEQRQRRVAHLREQQEKHLKEQFEKRRKEELKEELKRYATPEHLNRMDELTFEQHIANALEAVGYAVEAIKVSGDSDAVLLLGKDDRRIAVQLKRYSGTVGNSAVQQAYSSKGLFDADEAWVITNSFFTEAAQADADKLGVSLIEGRTLADWLQKIAQQLENEE